MTMRNLNLPMAAKNTSSLLLAAGLAGLVLALSGCEQGLGGGAYARPVVTILPDAEAAADSGAAAAADIEVAGYGTLKGRVVLEGTLTVPGPITPSKDPVCIASGPIPNDRIVMGDGGGLANVFVFLPKAPGGTKQPDALETVEFDQKGCRFLPHCLFAQTDQEILVLNSDYPTAHNTHTHPQRQSGFNQTIPKEGIPLTYSRPERQPVNVVCDIHPWMEAYHLPLDHPYGVVTSEDGSFEIANLPAGTHEFTIWHEVPGVVDSRYEVEIPVDGTAEVEIKVPAQALAQFQGPRPKRVVLSAIP